MENKQTAVEWLFKHIENVRIIDEYEFLKLKDALQQALQMEKYQIISSYIDGKSDAFILEPKPAEQYYTETYGKQTDRS